MIAALMPWAAGLAVATLVGGLAYRRLWIWLWRDNVTPTGFGALLAPAMVVAAWIGGGSPQLVWSLAAVTAGTFIYWLDDLRELGAWLRVGIAAAVGAAIAAIYFVPAGFPMIAVAGLALVAVVVNVALVNMVNFQDGADLNLALLVLLSAGLLLLYGEPDREWVSVALACLAFSLPFALLNVRPRTLYFGDSGSFAFGALFTILGVAFLAGPVMPPPEAAIPAALPFVDTIYVTAIRVRIRQRFTVRHYFHLYQRLQRDRPGFIYLLPQVLCAGLCLGVATLLGMAGLGRVLSVAIAMAIVAPLFFVACHRFWLIGEPGPPEPRS